MAFCCFSCEVYMLHGWCLVWRKENIWHLVEGLVWKWREGYQITELLSLHYQWIPTGSCWHFQCVFSLSDVCLGSESVPLWEWVTACKSYPMIYAWFDISSTHSSHAFLSRGSYLRKSLLILVQMENKIEKKTTKKHAHCSFTKMSMLQMFFSRIVHLFQIFLICWHYFRIFHKL